MPSILDLGRGLSRNAIIQLALSKMDGISVIDYTSPGQTKNPIIKELEATFDINLDIVLNEYNWSFLRKIKNFSRDEVEKKNKNCKTNVRLQTTKNNNTFQHNCCGNCDCGSVVIKSIDDIIRLLPSYFVNALAYKIAVENATVFRKDIRQLEISYRNALSKAIISDQKNNCHHHHHHYHHYFN